MINSKGPLVAVKILGIVASFALPLFNIPLILQIKRRKSSADISQTWAIGVWVCILLMTPSVFFSTDMVFRVFGVVNLTFFTLVVFYVLKYR